MAATSNAPPTSIIKRLFVGRAFTSQHLEHTLLPKVLALPVFASDALSSVAYATGEILIALTLVTSHPQSYVMPIAIAIALLMAIVVSSYRQTVRAYPGGGGAYIVSKDNLGTLPGLVAAAALLFDYMMTVVVSVVAGVFAIGSAFEWANEHRVLLSILFVLLVTFANLRGARESGTVFAIPTYGFVISILVLVMIGLARCLGGCPAVGVHSDLLPGAATTAAAVGLFAILKAFSQGATALTGVEAISNGVPAFKRPQARNAAATLAIMGTIAVTMFLGISWLATHMPGVVASEQRSVVAQIAIGIFGNSSPGFFVVQFFTAAILILAANTAYQDFPRLASILARDRFMPSQFVNRGDRLVFSNGVIVLGLLSCAMIYAFHADLNTLIHFYVVGVFTSFTLSQTGMVKHWLAEGRKGDAAMRGWRRSIVINIIGAITTAIVLIVVVISKFAEGAWLSILIIGLLVPGFYSIHKHYAWVRAQTRRGSERPGELEANHVVLLVRDVDASTAEALGYVRSFRPASLHPVTPGGSVPPDLAERWRSLCEPGTAELEALGAGNLTSAVRAYVRRLQPGPRDVVTVMVPEIVDQGLVRYLVGENELVRLKAGLLGEPGVVVTDVPVVEDPARHADVSKPLIPQKTVTLVFVSSVNDVTVRAINYARTLDATITRAIYFDVDPDQANRLEASWFNLGLDVPLDIVEAPFRDLTRPMLNEVRRFSVHPHVMVNVLVPEVIVSHWWQLPLHNQSALFIKRLFLHEDRVLLTSVPFLLERDAAEVPVQSV
ncbi:MAG: APC family permease [Actinobacteria bacterium]|nr:MAG: APC family permease [Actinomycetota bacterium]TMK92000.1 MAG: APC family permease [Actinomycetota bacterium]